MRCKAWLLWLSNVSKFSIPGRIMFKFTVSTSRFALSKAALAVLALGIITSGCRTRQSVEPGFGNTALVTLSSGAVVGATAVSHNGNSGDFDLDLFIVDSAGHPVAGLDPSSFGIPSSLDSNFSPLSILPYVTAAAGPYSAELLIDQTGSIKMTDPYNMRLFAAKAFLGLLGDQDEVQVSTFQDVMHIGHIIDSYHAFSHNVDPWIRTVDGFANTINGDTPLYDAMYDEVDTLVQHASNANKVLIVFTDGGDNDSRYTLWDPIEHAIQNNVKVFAIALKLGNSTPLATIAAKTGGAVMHAEDPATMVPFYSALGSYLHGNVGCYRTRWHTTVSNLADLSGQTVKGSVSVKNNGKSIQVPFAVTF